MDYIYYKANKIAGTTKKIGCQLVLATYICRKIKFPRLIWFFQPQLHTFNMHSPLLSFLKKLFLLYQKSFNFIEIGS